MSRTRKILIFVLALVGVLLVLSYTLSRRASPEHIVYGASFSKLHADELGLDWKATYVAMLDELGVRHLRLSAHWTMVEPQEGQFNFDELDFQMAEAAKRNADVILAVGRRLPGWPECHNPQWTINLAKDEREAKIREYLTAVVERYRDAPNLRYFQVENEPFLHFAPQYCGSFDADFLQEQIELVRTLDQGKHPILVTDSGEAGRWSGAWQAGDVFGTSVYLYVWYNPFGPLRYPMTPGFFRAKQNILEFFYGEKRTMLIELGMEPWLNKPIVNASLEEQMERMGFDKFTEIIDFARETGFDEQYLWGAEWWYYLKEQHGRDEFWREAQKLFPDARR